MGRPPERSGYDGLRGGRPDWEPAPPARQRSSTSACSLAAMASAVSSVARSSCSGTPRWSRPIASSGIPPAVSEMVGTTGPSARTFDGDSSGSWGMADLPRGRVGPRSIELELVESLFEVALQVDVVGEDPVGVGVAERVGLGQATLPGVGRELTLADAHQREQLGAPGGVQFADRAAKRPDSRVLRRQDIEGACAGAILLALRRMRFAHDVLGDAVQQLLTRVAGGARQPRDRMHLGRGERLQHGDPFSPRKGTLDARDRFALSRINPGSAVGDALKSTSRRRTGTASTG